MVGLNGAASKAGRGDSGRPTSFNPHHLRLVSFGGGLQPKTSRIMKKSHNAFKTQLPFTIPKPTHPLDLKLLPGLLEMALDLLLDGFDYEANIESNQAISIRILAVTLHHLNNSLGGHNEKG